MNDNPLKPESAAVNGYITPSHGRGRLRPFQRGQSGNPGGVAGRYQEVVRLCREAGPAVAKRLIEIALDPNEERRIVVVAGQEVLNRGFGRVREMRDGDLRGPAMNLEGMSEEKLLLIIRALEMAQKVKRAQASEGEDGE